jgi:class 3 adenylate cyclase
MAEGEAEWWRSEVQSPVLEEGGADALGRRAGEVSPRLSDATDRAVMAIYHAQQMQVWLTNIAEGIATALDEAGLHERDDQPPAMCFVDLAGFTRLTQERGDAAAAELAGRLNRIVQRISVRHGGRPVKWLGDGVMCYFPDPGPAVLAAIEMVAEISEAGLPRPHVGIHAGPVISQQGDYFGQTVNLAARIGEYARPGEVLVSRDVVDAADEAGLTFREVGPIGLKGVSEPVELYGAELSSG